ncbi:MAG: MmgE/PrpD family protein, partial [Planctomycetales bacterium]|nr:MmgE/PrpD family protein [Planctomycetales bacterium]
MRRAMRGFVGPADIFRNPQAVFCLFEKPKEPNTSPFDLELAASGGDFAVMGMHFKLGLYEHQSAGAIGGLLDLLAAHPSLLTKPDDIERIRITIYEPAFSIIGDPHKRDPRTRQSADHSMVYIVGTLLRKALLSRLAHEASAAGLRSQGSGVRKGVEFWRDLMLVPADYDDAALLHPLTRSLMDKIEFVHGGAEYDAKYPDGIPTTVEIDHRGLGRLSSGLVMYPEGHARNKSGNLPGLLAHKFRALASLGVREVDGLLKRFSGLSGRSANELRSLYDFELVR